jgi:hypothetical protein
MVKYPNLSPTIIHLLLINLLLIVDIFLDSSSNRASMIDGETQSELLTKFPEFYFPVKRTTY